MTDHKSHDFFVFPRWTNVARALVAAAAVGGAVYAGVVVSFGFSPVATDVGYQPQQPVPYSHAIHAGKLGVDCRYCHVTVETAASASLPPTQTCMNCHSAIKTGSDKLEAVRASYASGMPIPWVRVHDLPDYVYFDHSAHVRRGVGCVSCHGRVDRMEVVTQVEPLSMGWCLDCHRHPEPALRPPELATTMDWQAEGDPAALGRQLRQQRNINPRTDCNTCHR